MTYYAVHFGMKTGVFKSWQEANDAITGVEHPVYKKCFTKASAEHFAYYGVMPHELRCETKHFFIAVSKEHYCIFNEQLHKHSAESYTVPSSWGEMSKELSSLLAMSTCLQMCATRFPPNTEIIIHVDFPYAYHCITKWISSWKKTNFIKQNNEIVSFKVLMEILDAQKSLLPHVHFNFLFGKHIDNIQGLYHAKYFLTKLHLKNKPTE